MVPVCRYVCVNKGVVRAGVEASTQHLGTLQPGERIEILHEKKNKAGTTRSLPHAHAHMPPCGTHTACAPALRGSASAPAARQAGRQEAGSRPGAGRQAGWCGCGACRRLKFRLKKRKLVGWISEVSGDGTVIIQPE